MNEGSLPDFVVLGPQKCATTWIYRCLEEHPEVFVPETDSIHYFDMNYRKGEKWYQNCFAQHDGEPIVGEETPSYIRDEVVPERIAQDVPDAKLIISVRNPMDRAYSHYWHEKSKGKLSFAFEEVFENYDLFQNWVVPGFYHRHIRRFLEEFPEEQVKLVFFDDLVEDDEAFISDVFEFVGADPDYTPSFVDERVNEARDKLDFETINRVYHRAFDFVQTNFPQPVKNILHPLHTAYKRGIVGTFGGKDEYEKGMDANVRRRLEELYVEEIRLLEAHTGRDFSHWFEYPDAVGVEADLAATRSDAVRAE
jgi:hypothetical protein